MNLKEEFINKEIKELKDYLTDEEIKELNDYLTDEEINDLKYYEIEYIMGTLRHLNEMEDAENRIDKFIGLVKSRYCFNHKRKFIGLRWIADELMHP